MKALWVSVNAQAGWVFLVGVILVTLWNGYRWRQDRALALRLRGKKPESVSLRAWPKVSVLVAAWNEAHIIRKHIESFLRLRYPNKELILCAGGDDGTYQIACQYTGQEVVVLQQQAGEGKQRALRRGFERMSGDIIFLTDADCVLDDESFGQTIAPIAHNEEKAATGWVKPLDTQLRNPYVAYLWSTQQYWIARSPEYIQGLQGGNAALERQTLKQLGGFDADVATGTDYYLANLLIASGRRIRSVPGSLMRTRYHTRLSDYCRQRSRWARNNILHAARFRVWRIVRRELRASIVALFVVVVPLSVGGLSRFVWSLWGLVLVQLLLIRLRMLLFVKLYGPEQRLPLMKCAVPMLIYTFTDCVASVRALSECVLPSLRRRW